MAKQITIPKKPIIDIVDEKGKKTGVQLHLGNMAVRLIVQSGTKLSPEKQYPFWRVVDRLTEAKPGKSIILSDNDYDVLKETWNGLDLPMDPIVGKVGGMLKDAKDVEDPKEAETA